MYNENEATLSEVMDSGTYDPNSLLFKHDRIYRHRIMRINYTTYDARRSQDVVNPSTSNCNIMVLQDDSENAGNSAASCHHFSYARILGIYHVNAIYVGYGTLDYKPRRIEFLWVRWYQTVDTKTTGWKALKLDRIRFSPMGDVDAFGFIDPSDVLRSCYIVPTFARGRPHMIREDISPCAQNSSDYIEYYLNR
jgi:hypothetical protein